jgi:PAS domain S-box-containing protein
MATDSNIISGRTRPLRYHLDQRSGWLRQGLAIVVVAAIYYGSAKLGLSLAFIHTNVSAVWPPSGIAIAAVLLFGYRIWPGILLGAFLANSFTPVSLVTSVVIAAGNTLEAASARYLLQRLGFQLELRKVKDVTKLVTAILICTTVAATIGNLALCVTHAAKWPEFGGLWVTWWLGDAVGGLIVAPLVIVWSGAARNSLPARRYLEGALVMVLLAAAALATFTGPSSQIALKLYPLARLTVPFYLYAAFRLGYPGVTLGTVIVSIFAAWGTARGVGLFAGREGNDALLLLQLYAGSNAVTFLFLVAAVEERRGTDAALRENQDRLAANLAVTEILTDSPSLNDAAPRILRTVGENLGWMVGALWMPTEDGSALRCFEVRHDRDIEVRNFVADTRARQFSPGHGLPGRVWRTRSSSWIQNVALDDNFPRGPVAVADGLCSAVAFPLLVRDRFLGVMEFFSTEERAPDAAMLAMFTNVGSQIGLFIERRQAENAVRELAAIVESAEDAVLGKDLEGRITSWNAGAQKLFGYSPAEIVNRGIFTLVPPELHDAEREILAKLKRGESMPPFESVRRASDGTDIDVSLTISPVRSAEGVVIGGSTIARDITERKAAEKERERLLRREQDARAEAEAANRSKDEFLASVSHELRTPLNAIVGWSALLNASMLDEESQRQAIEVIDRNAKLQARLIEDLLDVSRIVSGNIRFERHPVSLPEVIEAAIDSVRPSADAKQIRLHVEMDPTTGLVQGDADRLQQVVWNLLNNAVKFTPDAGRVEVRLRPVDAHAELAISDTGEGIRADFLPFVFDRFRQADSTTTRRHRGIGIGLAIVQHLVNLHQGSVVAESDGEGKGATFRVTLPTLNRNGSPTAPADTP